MNAHQRKVLACALVVFVATGVYLPFDRVMTELPTVVGGRQLVESTEVIEFGTAYYWLWSVPSSTGGEVVRWTYRLDYKRLLAEWAFLLVVTAGAFALLAVQRGAAKSGVEQEI